jgi:DNA-binding SARP family transcriptional activator
VAQFRILGPLEAAGESGPVPLGGPKQRALLALLLLHANETLSSERIIDELWGEQPPRTAASSLQNFVAQLRRLLGPDVLVTRSPGYVLRVERDDVDAARFESMVGEARRAAPAERAEKLHDALDLWRGEPLTDVAFEPFAQNEVRRLEDLRLAATEDLVDAELELGRHADVVGELETLVQQHPLRERLRGHLMVALYRSGRQADALRAYHEARRALVDELGIEPSPALQQLHSSILRQEAALDPSATPRAGDDHLAEVERALLMGRLVPVLGPAAAAATDAAARLAKCFGCPPEHAGDLSRISQYVAVTHGIGPLYDELHTLFAADAEPGRIHHFLANLPPLLRERGAAQQLIVTTSYGHALERAFEDAGEEFDLVWYIATGRDRGKFVHRDPDRRETVIDVPNAYTGIDPAERTVILKIHGAADPRPERVRESFVVSEDDYIGYLAQAELASAVPVTLVAKLRRSHFLFLGYPLVEWSLRVFLHRVFADEPIGYRSWAVQPAVLPIQRDFWRGRHVDVFDVGLDEYANALERRLRASAMNGSAA